VCALFENRAPHLRRSGMDDSEAHSMLSWAVRIQDSGYYPFKRAVSRYDSPPSRLPIVVAAISSHCNRDQTHASIFQAGRHCTSFKKSTKQATKTGNVPKH